MLQHDVMRSQAGIWPVSVEDVEFAGIRASVIETGHSLWIFDRERLRFQRVPRDVGLGNTSGEWQRYYRFELDATSGAFAVGLNPDGTWVLRSWLHAEPCPKCHNEDPPAGVTR